MKETICQKAKRLLEPIPSEKIITSFLTTEDGHGCPEGWLNGLGQGLDTPAIYGDFAYAVNDHIEDFVGNNCGISWAANGRQTRYTQDTPKARTMALLDDCIAAGL